MSSLMTAKCEPGKGGDQVAVMVEGQPVAVNRDEDKMPLFLIKLWNIVEDPAYQQIVHWDDTGYSFHIVDPYSFCRNVLPHYFKHNNLNSLIRQLNMYGFRKMTPLERSGLTRAESDQDHLEFSHPYFVRDHPELLVNIKRKSSNRAETNNSSHSSQVGFTAVTEELRQLREKQRTMDAKMAQLVKENESMWDQMSHMRAQHHKQQQVVTKLVQFLVALVQPSHKPRIPKRGMLALDEPPSKRTKTSPSASANVLSDVLDNLHRQLSEGGLRANTGGPIIADITEEVGNASNPLVTSPPSNNMQQNSPTSGPSRMMDDMAGPSACKDEWLFPPGTCPSPSINPSSPKQFNSAITLSPSIDMQWSNDLQEYLNGIDTDIVNCRDLLGRDNLQWEMNGDMNFDQWNGEDGGQLALEGRESTTPELLTPSTSPLPGRR